MSLDAFLDEFWGDLDADGLRPLEAYLAKYPDLRAEIEREYRGATAEQVELAHPKPAMPQPMEDATRHPGTGGGAATPASPRAPTGARAPALTAANRALSNPRAAGRHLGRHDLPATDPSNDRKVVLKPLPMLTPSAQTLDRLRARARIAAELEHPGICPVLDVITADGVAFAVMPWLEGESLAQRIAAHERRGPIALWRVFAAPVPDAETATIEAGGLPEVLSTFELIADAVQTAHEADLIHRSLAPDSVVLAPDGRPVITDFGLSVRRRRNRRPAGRARHRGAGADASRFRPAGRRAHIPRPGRHPRADPGRALLRRLREAGRFVRPGRPPAGSLTCPVLAVAAITG